LAVVVHVAGPEFLDEENQKVFARIEESIRQYSTHTRETMHLVRRPLHAKYDHFALLWTRGAALIGLFPFGGTIRGSRKGAWTSEQPRPDRGSTDRDRSSSESSFNNPYEVLVDIRREFAQALQIVAGTNHAAIPITKVGAAVESVALATEGNSTSAAPSSNVLSPSLEDRLISDIQLIAIFIHPVTELRLEESLWDKTFTAMPAEYAISRTMLHTPNLLRAIDRESAIYSNAELQTISDLLERQSELNELPLEAATAAGVPILRLHESRKRRRRWRRWGISIAVLLAVIIYYALRSSLRPAARQHTDSTLAAAPATQRPRMLVIELPSDVQLLVSSSIYKTRSDLDHALSHGEGQRYLPSSEQTIVLDSLTFAKGVYGYFKVDNTWRKGKLLQTFQPNDTIHIDNFLPPLP
jgi:hypothetical protein